MAPLKEADNSGREAVTVIAAQGEVERVFWPARVHGLGEPGRGDVIARARRDPAFRRRYSDVREERSIQRPARRKTLRMTGDRDTRGSSMPSWHLTKRGDYINSSLAGRTRAGIVSLERSGLWAFVIRALTGQEIGRGANYPTAAAAMEAAEAFTAPTEPNRDLAAQVMGFLRDRQRRADQ